jgi:hypothetical protein
VFVPASLSILVSISPIFYEQLFHTEVFLPSFYVLTIWVCAFWQKDFGAKAAHKMLPKLTPSLIFAGKVE